MRQAMNPDETVESKVRLTVSGAEVLPGDDRPGTAERSHRGAARAYRVCDRLTEAVLVLAVVFNPWALGTTTQWAVWAMNVAGYVLGAFWVSKWVLRVATGYRPARWRGHDHESASPWARWLIRVMGGLTVLLLGYVLTSAINARAVFNADRLAFDYFECVPWLPHTYDRAATWFAFWEYLGLACTFWAARDWLGGKTEEEAQAEERTTRGRTDDAHGPGRRYSGGGSMPVRVRRLLMALCVTGALVGLEGTVQRLAGTNKLLFVLQPLINRKAEGQFGPYANRNNAAEYLNLLWPVCAGLAWASAQTAGRNRREGRRRPGTAHRWLAIGAVLMGAGTFISSSRGGSIVAAGMLPVALIVMLTMTRASSVGTKVGLGLLFAAALQVAVVFGWDTLAKRFETVFTDDLGGRLGTYKNAEAMARDYALFGCGAGSFGPMYYLYRNDPDAVWAGYLHNDWLELRITLGWVGFGMALALLAGAFLHWFLRDGAPLSPFLAVLIWLALLGCLVHARFDFPFQVHSLATVFLLYCSILSCSQRARE